VSKGAPLPAAEPLESGPETSPDIGLDRGAARRQAFLAAAKEVFLEQGFEAASVGEVVRRAGGSLATLYAQFGNKEGLFQAVVLEQRERFMRELEAKDVRDLPLEDGLQAIGERFLRAILRPDHVAFFRIVVGEGRKFPQLMQNYLAAGFDRVRNSMATYLIARGEIEAQRIADPESAAAYFFDLVRSKHPYRALADASFRLTEEELVAHVRKSVRFFLNGALPR